MSELMAKLARRRSLNGEESIPKIESKIDTTLISQSNNVVKSDDTQQNIDIATVATDIDTNNEQLKPNNEVSNNETNNEVSTNVDDNTLTNIDLRDSTQDNRSSNSDKKDPSQPSNNSKWYPGKYLGFKPRTDKGDAKNSSGDNDNRNSNVDTLEKEDMDTAIDKDIDDFLSTINDKETSNKSFYKRNKSSSNDNLFDDTDDNISGSVASSRDGTNETLEIQNTKLKLQVANLVKEIRYKDQTILNLQKEKALLVSELNKFKLNKSSPAKGKGFESTKNNLNERLHILGYDSNNLFSDILSDKTDEIGRLSEEYSTLFGNADNALLSSNSTISERSLVGSNLISTSVERNSYDITNNDMLNQLSSATTNNLFDASNDGDVKKQVQKKELLEIPYEEFIVKIALPECHEIVDLTRKFISSVLGPNGDLTPPAKNAKIDYIFYGTAHLSRRFNDFLDHARMLFSKLPSWKNETEERVMSARDNLERYIMNRIAEVAFNTVQVPDQDNLLATRMKLLSFIGPEALEIKESLRNDMVLALARDELRKMNSYRTPSEKVECIVKCAAVIFSSLNLARGKDGKNDDQIAGADDFLPMFIYVVLKSDVPKLASNCEFISSFHNPSRLLSKNGYCFVNLQSAIEFILNVDSDSVKMDALEFERKLAENQRQLNGGF